MKVDYGLSCRCISVLWGEAYFRVAHDDPRTFRVSAGSCRVYDIGTAFVVRDGGKLTQVGVLEGAVQVRTAEFRRIVHAGELLAFNRQGAEQDTGATGRRRT
ncbi:MAG: FecR domain-containing protein [Nitrococcus sp.]|nr:FecR domain-containing protein [Nitrococcus sp.]